MARNCALTFRVMHAVRLNLLGSQNVLLSRYVSSGPASGSPVQSNSAVPVKDDADARIKKFIDPEVQKILKDLTGLDYGRVFRARKLGQHLEEPKYSFMTENQLKQSLEEAHAKAETILQMPPVLSPRKPIEKVLSRNPEISGYDTDNSTLIFTDITMGVSDRNRVIVARDPDGTLRRASWEERDKVNRIYYSMPEREVKTPKMFLDLNVLKEVLGRASEEDNTYEFVLDRACVQFEPDDPMYITRVELTYETVDAKGHYDYLKSTRHYGPFVFYLLRHRKIDNLLMHTLDQDSILDAGRIISLFTKIFPDSVTTGALKYSGNDEEDAITALRSYIEHDSVLKAELQIHLNALLERRKSNETLQEGLRQSHGM